MGKVKANDLLLFNKTMTAQEAKEAGLVTEVFSPETFDQELKERLEEMSQFPPNSLERIKKICRVHDTDYLHEVNERECQHLVNVWQSPECTRALEMITAKLSGK